jgi:Protein of unknown function (DUF2934)
MNTPKKKNTKITAKKTTATKTVKAAAPAKKILKSKMPAVKPTQTVKPVKDTAPTVSVRAEVTKESIASRAFTLWEQAGRPHGRDLEFWSQAENQLKQNAQSVAA